MDMFKEANIPIRHKFLVQLSGKGLVLSYPGDNTEVWVSCNCPYHMFYTEFALTKKKSSDLLYGNGKPPVIKNPRNIAFACKHVLKALETAKNDYARLNKTKKLEQQLGAKDLVDAKKYKLFDKNNSPFDQK